MGLLRLISLRQRFLLAPLIGIALSLIMYLGSDQIIRSNSSLLQDLQDANLPQISEVSRLTVKLSDNHSQLTTSLIAALEHRDEERVYLAARDNLFALHDIQGEFSRQLSDVADRHEVYASALQSIREAFVTYRETAIGSIELSTVDAGRAKAELLSANASLATLNRRLLEYANTHMAQLRSGASRIENSLGENTFVSLLSVLLVGAMIASALYFSKRMSVDIDAFNRTLTQLARGDSATPVHATEDRYLKQLADVATVFKTTLQDNQAKRAELQRLVSDLKDSQNRYSSLLNITATAIVVIDESQTILLFNRAAESVFGHGQSIIGESLDTLIPERFRRAHAKHTAGFASSDIRMMAGSDREPIFGLRSDGSEFPIEVSISKLHLANQTLMTAAITDITLRRRQEEKILHQAHFDHLTDLPNRFLTLDRLEQMLKEARRFEHIVAVLFLDLDDFKKVNDTLNHETGDLLLVETAKRLRESARDGDTVGRLGGDEFLMLIGGLRSPGDVQRVAAQLIDQFKQPMTVAAHELRVTLSIGISVYPMDGDNASTLLRNADLAMYSAKQQGRDTYSFFTERMNQENARRLALDEQMHGAIERGEFFVEYQPLYDLGAQTIVGFEALARWRSATMGLINPDEFIRLAEQNRMIDEIGRFVIEETLSALKSISHRGGPALTVSINLSPVQLRDPELPSFLTAAANRHGIAAEQIELEVTEGVFLDGRDTTLQALNDLSALGFGIAMDDFGTGYASLSYLRSYPFHTLKIDRQFIHEITDSQVDRKLVKAAIDMAHGLGLSVVAEGVEREDQLTAVAALGCDIAQGYFISRPIPLAKLTAFLEAG